MKTLTLTQPWASLVASGAKQIETRSWGTSYRGPLAIHAAKGFSRGCKELCFYSPFNEELAKADFQRIVQLPVGMVVATCELMRVLPITSFATVRIQAREYCGIELSDREGAFGDYGPGRFAWVLKNVKRLDEPVPAKGALGLWEWSPTEEG